MRSSETVLGMLQDRGKREAPIQDLYRQLFNPHLYLRAYARLYSNEGAMTRGATNETADGMSLKKIFEIIELIKQERFHWTPVRRTYIPKKNGKLRPLGLPIGLSYCLSFREMFGTLIAASAGGPEAPVHPVSSTLPCFSAVFQFDDNSNVAGLACEAPRCALASR